MLRAGGISPALDSLPLLPPHRDETKRELRPLALTAKPAGSQDLAEPRRTLLGSCSGEPRTGGGAQEGPLNALQIPF